MLLYFFFFNHTATTEIYTLSLHDALPICDLGWNQRIPNLIDATTSAWIDTVDKMVERHPNATFVPGHGDLATDRKSTRLNSSHPSISYAVFCLKKKKKQKQTQSERANRGE